MSTHSTATEGEGAALTQDGSPEPAPWRRRVGVAFRTVALIEAATWIGLLIGMAFKYVLSDNEAGVKLFGPLHGVAFLAYVTVTCVAARTFGWSRRLWAVGLLASIPPAATWPFERMVARRGRLH